MIKEQKKKCEDIINLYNEKYNKDLEDLYHNVSELNDKEIYVREALAFWDHYYDPIELIFGMLVPLSFILFQMQGCEMEFFEFWRKSTYIAKENIINMTVSLSEIFNKNMTKEEVEKLLFIKNSEEGLTDFLATEKFRDISKYEYAFDIKRIIPDLEVEFDLPLREKYESVFHIKGIGLAMVQYFDNGENKINYTIENIKKEKNMSNNEELKLNLLILGQTGAGKSSLLNKFAGKKLFKTADDTDKRVEPTTEYGIFEKEVEIDGKKVKIFDSWGLERNKAKEWEELIKDKLKERGVEKDIKDWFHSVTYCISRQDNGYEPFELNIIKELLNEKYNVIIALTKCDNGVDEEFIEKLKKDSGVNMVIPISANPQKSIIMTEAPEPFGLPEYKAAVLVSWRKIFVDRIPLHIIEKLKKDIKDAKDRAPKEGKNMEKLAEEIKEYFTNIIKEALDKYIKENLKGYYKTTVNILETSKSIDMKNFDFHGKIDDGDFFINILDFFNIESFIKYIMFMAFPISFIVFGLIKLIAFNKKSEKISECIDKVIEELINEISKKEFEDMIRKNIIEFMNNIEKDIPKLN